MVKAIQVQDRSFKSFQVAIPMASNLVFINTSGPDDSKSHAKRKAVRSQAARDRSQPSNSKAEGATRRRHRKLLSVEIDVDIYGSETSGSASPPTSADNKNFDYQAPRELAYIEEDAQEEDTGLDIGKSPDLMLGKMPGAGWTHPFVPYPNRHFVPAILSHCKLNASCITANVVVFLSRVAAKTVCAKASADPPDLSTMAVDIPELDHPGTKGALRSIWFPMVLAEQAVLNVVVLTATSNYVSVHQTQCSAEVLWQLKENAISSINRGLGHPELATSDQMIGAVAKMAAYEAGFAGDEEQYHVHMKGLTKMVELRGGLQALGLNGLLARMLLWIDLNAAFLLNTQLYFPHTNALPGHTVPQPNPGHFLGES
ncbi:MAG: hypothetical protein Q9173_007270 [Seirophora scorigena]